MCNNDGDIKNSKVVTLGFQVMNCFLNKGFKYQGNSN